MAFNGERSDKFCTSRNEMDVHRETLLAPHVQPVFYPFSDVHKICNGNFPRFLEFQNESQVQTFLGTEKSTEKSAEKTPVFNRSI